MWVCACVRACVLACVRVSQDDIIWLLLILPRDERHYVSRQMVFDCYG